MKIVLIDDEKAMHLIMKRMLSKIAEVEVVGSFQDTSTAEAFLLNHEVDLIFMDIQMPLESGLDLAKRLREQSRTVKLVFLTSHTEYALAAFEVYAFDYMVKPVVQERLRQTICRAIAYKPESSYRSEDYITPIKLVINCLGRMEIRSPEHGLLKWKSSKSAELCGYLVLQQGRLVSRARIIEDIFGGMPRKNAEIYLNTTAYQLRKLLESNGLKGSLHSDGQHYALNLDLAQVDIHVFELGCKSLNWDIATIEEAMVLEQLYIGELFGDLAYPWAWSEIERVSLLYTSFTQRLCQVLLVKGDIQPALRLLMKLTSHNELDEETIQLYMKALAMQRNKEALIRQYQHFTIVLQQEMGVSPSKELNSLYNKLLSEVVRLS
ncbi:two-component SAPR family response regulator [Paenibacillus shirakamiensis]|uniref:Two-component SAPR family response regulator n=1 Tax=Paenibacillus shirakamiensis TaxID=1265935 RepID=A0ABS4JKK5_9BACL|nr:response regulator [Paenibacillus shirakamiensis]MBP2002242.1 two-component SAPR family response regulator [Paenibacillus shirakamiensis]